MARRKARGIRVTATDLETGESRSYEFMDNFVLICAGTCYVSDSHVHTDGTVQITIKGRRAAAEEGES